MDYLALQSQVSRYLHRTDLANEIKEFIDKAQERINTRFGLDLIPFVNDTDTDAVLDEYSNLYLHAALVEGFAFLHNGGAATTYDQMWIGLSDKTNITNPGSSTDSYQDAPPSITNYIPPEV